MLYINKITKDASQQFDLTGIPGIVISMNLRYLPRMKMWNMGFTYNSKSVNGIAVVASPNILESFVNILPFGIACLTTNGLDPYNIDDFVTQAANLYLLDKNDIETINTKLFT